MDEDRLRRLLEEVRAGALSVEGAAERLRGLPFEDLGDLKPDHHRALRTGFPETIFGQGKTPEQILRAVGALSAAGAPALVTRTPPEAEALLQTRFPAGRWHPAARLFEIPAVEPAPAEGLVVVLSAGTADLPVAEEAAVTARAFGARVEAVQDAGVAGIHRLLAHRELLRSARVLVVVAGMEGALPSVVGGLVPGAVIAVPTSVGYGASFGGLAALLAMLNSCAAGVLVTNIDNGHGAGIAAARINRLGASGGPPPER